MKNLIAFLWLTFAGALFADNEQDVRQVLVDQAAAWNRGDVRGFMSFYWQSPHLRFGSGNSITYGFEPTQKRFLDKYNTPEKMGKLEYEILEVTRFDDNQVQLFGRWKLLRDHDKPNGLLTLNLKKIDNRWLIVSDHTSSE